MEEIDLNFSSESLLDRFAEYLNYSVNRLRGFCWSTQLDFMKTMGYLDSSLEGTAFEKTISAAKFALGAYSSLFGLCLIGLSNRFHSREFIFWEGEGELTSPEQLKVMHLNACMFPGSLPCHFGKQTPAVERMDRLSTKIQELKPSLIFLSEFSQVFTGELCNRLKGEYKLFFLNIGSNALGIESCLIGISKVPILSAQFIPTKIKGEGEQRSIYRGYFIVETKGYKFLYTHLHPKETEAAKDIRAKQLDEIKTLTDNGEKPWVVLGDINIDRNKDEYSKLNGFNDEVYKEHGKVTTRFEGGIEESVDYVLTKGERLKVKTAVIKDLNLSDHSTIIATISQ